MRSLLLTTGLLTPLLLGCTIHEPTHQIIYTPEKTLTNNGASGALGGQFIGEFLAAHGGANDRSGALLSATAEAAAGSN